MYSYIFNIYTLFDRKSLCVPRTDEMGTTMQVTDYYGYLMVRAYYGLFLFTTVTHWLGPIMFHLFLLLLLTG
jgi:hypothetical protein